jgi:hypothetical protein
MPLPDGLYDLLLTEQLAREQVDQQLPGPTLEQLNICATRVEHR